MYLPAVSPAPRPGADAASIATGSSDPELEILMVRSAVSARNGALAERRGDVLESRLSVLRTALEQQRDFRREQLAHLDVHQATPGSPVTDDSAVVDTVLALREVEALVAAGARRALADIEVALARMQTGSYGYCRVCGTDIPVVVLDAIPTTTVCLACQQSTDRSAIEGVRDRDGWVSVHGPQR
jgi:RNA polymerase-binding transcription factor DksA